MALTKIGKEGVTGISNSSNATAITIDSSENVGIDFTPKTMTANVTSSLNVGSGTVFQRTKDTFLASNMYYNPSDAGTSISTGYGLAYYQNVTNGAHQWFTSAASAGSADAAHSFTIPMTIDSAGIISKDGTFSYSGTSDNFYWNVGAGDRFRFHSGVTASRDILGFSNPNGGIGAINTNGTTTSFVTSSDYRLKTAVEYDWNATTRLKQLKPARFKWIADGDDAVEVDGFLAHEVESIIPEAITGNGKDAMMDEAYEVSAEEKDADGNVTKEAVMGTRSVPDLQGIDQSKLVPLLCKTILELEARITALETA